MRTFASAPRPHLSLLLAAAVGAASPLAAAAPTPLTQAWTAHLVNPPYGSLQAGGMSVGPSGDVFVASHVRPPDSDYDILLSRYDAAGSAVWQKRFELGGARDEYVTAAVAKGTNIYLAGTTRTDGGQGWLTLKVRDDGELEWAAPFEGPGSDAALAVDGQGNVIVAGNSVGPDGTADITVVKYGPSGNQLWTYYHRGPGPGATWDRTVGMQLDAAGNVHVAGSSEADGAATVITLKVSSEGQELWATPEISSQHIGYYAQGIDVDAAGNVVTVANERTHCVTWKYNAQGVRQWQARHRAEEPAGMSAKGARFDFAGNVITAANLYGSGTNDAVLIKYAPDGRQLWVTRISNPGGAAHLLAWDLDASGNAFLTTSPAQDMVTVKVGPDGVQLGSAVYHGGGFFADYGQFLEVTPGNDVVVAGRSVYFWDNFISLVKYIQPLVPGLPSARVTPALHLVDPGASVVFTAEATAPGAVQIQWRKNGRVLPGETNATLTLADVQPEHRGDYSVLISNPQGTTTSPESRLSVRTPPLVAVDPTNTTAYVGTETAFLAIVPGTDFISLQWRRDGTPLPGATNEVLQLDHLTAADAGLYDVVASSIGGSSTSSPARLRISSALTLAGATPHRSSPTTWEYIPQLSVLPNGDSLIAVRTNHPTRGSSILLRKHAADGALLWSAVFDSPNFTNAEPFHLARDAAGNIYLAGLSRQPFLPAAIALLKYSPEGNLAWSREFEVTNFWGHVRALAVDAEGSSTLGLLGGNGLKVIRHDHAGEVRWTVEDPSPIDTLAVAVDASGHSYIGTTRQLGNNTEIRLQKVNTAGATAWVRTNADGMYNQLGRLAVDANGNLIAVGTGDLPNVPDSRMFVLKYAPDGQKLWETRTGSGYPEISNIPALAIGPENEITVLTMSDDDYTPEHCGLTRLGPDGQLRYRIAEPQVLVSNPSQLALDAFGNAYITGYGTRPATGADAVTAKYDARGLRQWLVYHGGRSWESGLAVGADAAGVIRVMVPGSTTLSEDADFILLRYTQRDPASNFRLQLIPGAAGTFHLGAPAGEPFRIETSTDLQNWTTVEPGATQQLLQPGGSSFSSHSQRFFRLISD